jgi:single-strand DNA-binding protein
MADLNKVFLIGRLTHDPELRYTPSGAPVSDLRLATSRVYTTKEGDRREDTLYIDISVWNRQAENCCQYLKKGSQIHVEGHLKMDSWEDRTSGEKRTKIRVEGERVQFLDTRRGGEDSGAPPRSDVEYDEPPARRAPPAGGGGGGEPRGGPNGSGPRPYAPPPRRPAPGQDEQADEDIPF